MGGDNVREVGNHEYPFSFAIRFPVPDPCKMYLCFATEDDHKTRDKKYHSLS